jgi:hypothetical protein
MRVFEGWLGINGVGRTTACPFTYWAWLATSPGFAWSEDCVDIFVFIENKTLKYYRSVFLGFLLLNFGLTERFAESGVWDLCMFVMWSFVDLWVRKTSLPQVCRTVTTSPSRMEMYL